MTLYAETSTLELRAASANDALASATRRLAELTYAKIEELAHERLHSRLPTFLDALRMEPDGEGGYRIVLAKAGAWIDDGMEPRDMLPDLLRSPKAKFSKDGRSKYVVVPMGSGHRPQAGGSLGATIRTQLGAAKQRALARESGEVRFRTASSKQDGMWHHPGTPPAHIFEDAQRYVDEKLVEEVFDKAMAGLFG